MERLLAAAPALARGARSSRRRARSSARGRRPARSATRTAPRPHLLVAAPRALARSLRGAFEAVWARRRLRIAALVTLVCAPLLGGGWVWLRHSPLVSVEHVRLSGVSGRDAKAIRSALLRASHGMSTLDVKQTALRAAVAGFPIVREVHASASFPHTLHVAVVEQPPVAVLVSGGTRTAVAADGVVLGPALASSSLPTMAASAAPPPGQRLGAGAWQVQAATALGAAPAALAREVQSAYSGSKGLTVVMQGDLAVYFGDSSRARAKWLALASVMSQEHAAGVSYVDVRVPERAAAGFGSGVVPSGGSVPSGASEGESSTHASDGSESGTEALATRLREAGGEESMGTERSSKPWWQREPEAGPAEGSAGPRESSSGEG